MTNFSLELFRIVADADPCKMDPTQKACSSSTSDVLARVVGQVVDVLFLILGIVSVLVAIYAGFLLMTSAGDPGKVKKGKDALIGSCIGIVIGFSAFAIVKFFMDSM